eukprot:11782-Rhodomonas_salina.2
MACVLLAFWATELSWPACGPGLVPHRLPSPEQLEQPAREPAIVTPAYLRAPLWLLYPTLSLKFSGCEGFREETGRTFGQLSANI